MIPMGTKGTRERIVLQKQQCAATVAMGVTWRGRAQRWEKGIVRKGRKQARVITTDKRKDTWVKIGDGIASMHE